MKKSYSLLTIHLDRLPLPAKPLRLVASETMSDVLELGSVYCLFDYPVCRRKLSASKMLQTESLLKLRNLVEVQPECTNLVVELDLNCYSEIMNLLFFKRCVQAIQYLKTEFPTLTFWLACPHEDMKMWLDVMDQLLPKS
ncbi:hypothetical protein [Lactobacillus sp.]|uniref:hypothetical protein n=1 Tax=Lactobacillus sp. TaxID=1591 RepID=UPI003EF70161